MEEGREPPRGGKGGGGGGIEERGGEARSAPTAAILPPSPPAPATHRHSVLPQLCRALQLFVSVGVAARILLLRVGEGVGERRLEHFPPH
jgi:hypothetical protein